MPAPRPRRLPRTLLAGLCLLPAAAAAAPGDALQAFLDRARGLSAEFEQEVRDADGRLLTVASGELQLLRPDRFRWRYRAPEPLLLVADGANFWSWDPLLEQATVTPLEQALRATPLAMLLRRDDLRGAFRAVREFARDGLDWTALEPRGDSAVAGLEIGLRGGTLARLRFTDALGQEVRMRFHAVRVNPPLGPADFAYRPPAGADVLGAPMP